MVDTSGRPGFIRIMSLLPSLNFAAYRMSESLNKNGSSWSPAYNSPFTRYSYGISAVGHPQAADVVIGSAVTVASLCDQR
ncbi:MAG: hypothetical protein ACRD3P_15165 [Terriglobales bacterium]